MEEIKNTTKITYAKNLQTLTINSTISALIDSNVNIKRVLDIQTYTYDTKTECGNGKAIITGKLGVKVLYLDTDNITNTLMESQSFSENYVNSAITNDCLLNISEQNITHTILSTDNNLKISCDINIKPIVYMNLPISTNSGLENMIVKKSELHTNTITQFVNTKFDYSNSFETKDSISKVLCCNSYYSNSSLSCHENYAVAEGKLYSTIIYETIENEETKLKQITDCFNIKTDINIEGISKECLLDVSFVLDSSMQNISTEIEDENNIVNILNTIKVVGVCTKNVNIELIDDAYSIENEVEVSLSKRDFTKELVSICFEESVSNEINLQNDETAIDEVVANMQMCTEITNCYIKNNSLFLEGVISSNLVYLDENKEYQSKICEVPFIIDSKNNMQKLDCTHADIQIIDCKVKIKRGTIIELEYKLCANTHIYEQEEKEIINNVNMGKVLDFSNFDYQIYLTKPNENMWDLCKRIKTTPEQINKYNKNLPLEFSGKEKIIIKR